MTISERLMKIMKERNISAYTLHKNSGLSRVTIRYIIRGISKNPRVDTLRALAKVLKCTVQDLAGE